MPCVLADFRRGSFILSVGIKYGIGWANERDSGHGQTIPEALNR